MRKCRIIDRLALTKHGVIRLVNDGQEKDISPPSTLRGQICPECGNHSLFPEAVAGTANLADTASAT